MDLMGISDFARLSRLSPRALRLYDELGLLPPARVDPDSGYRWYSAGQLAPARLIATLRGIGMPLAQIRTVAGADRAAAAGLVGSFWAATEREHSGRRQLAAYLVDQLSGERAVMYDVAVRDIPERSLLCLQRAATDEAEVFALGKEFIAILREHELPQLDGPGGEVFLIYHGEVSADSDGPVEMCRPVPAGQAAQLAAAVPVLTLRTEPAHREAYVHLGNATMTGPQWELLTRSMQDWAADQQQEPGDLGVRITFRHLGPGAVASAPDTDFAVPLRDSGDRGGGKDIRVSR